MFFTFQCIFVYPIQQGIGDEDGCVVRLRGLPWSATESEVVKFFGGKLMMIFSLFCKYMIFCKVCSTLLHRKLEQNIFTSLTLTEDVEIVDGEQGVHFTFSREGRPSGECFVELIDEDNVQRGLKCHNKHMGNRYIEGLYWEYVPSSWSKF